MLAELAAARVPVVLFEASFWEKIPTSWPGTPLSAIARDPWRTIFSANIAPARF